MIAHGSPTACAARWDFFCFSFVDRELLATLLRTVRHRPALIFMALFGLFSKEKKETLDKGLEKTKDSFFSKLGRAVVGKSTVEEEVLAELEKVLISSHVCIETTIKIIP